MESVMRLVIRRLAGLTAFLVLLLAAGDYAGQAVSPQPAAYADADAVEASIESVRLPVIMYHSILQDPKRQGAYVASPTLLEQDMRYLSEMGYQSVTPMELINYTRGLGDLPEKPVLITFDDGFYNNLLYALPILEKWDMHAVISVIGFATDQFSHSDDKNPMYAYLDWDDICALRESERIDIGNHTFHLHSTDGGRSGVKREPGESVEDHKRILLEDIGGLQQALQAHCGFTPLVFAYPFGKYDDDSEKVLRELGFPIGLTCYERVNTLTRDPKCLYKLGRFNRPGNESTFSFMQRVLK